MKHEDLSCSDRNYLDCIYHLSKLTNSVRPVDIANDLHVTKPSVTRAIKILAALGMIYKNYHGEIILTSKGVRTAQSLSNQCKTLKDFFNEICGGNSIPSNQDILKISYMISNETLEAIQAYLKLLKV